MEDKKTLLNIVVEAVKRGKQGEEEKAVFNELIAKQIEKRQAGIAEMETTTKMRGKQSEKGSVMSQYDEETKEKLQEAVNSLSSSGKKSIKMEQIVTDSDVNKLVDKIEKLSVEDAKIIAKALDI